MIDKMPLPKFKGIPFYDEDCNKTVRRERAHKIWAEGFAWMLSLYTIYGANVHVSEQNERISECVCVCACVRKWASVDV